MQQLLLSNPSHFSEESFIFNWKRFKSELNHDLEKFMAFLEHPISDNILIIYAPYDKLDERKKVVKLLKKQSEFLRKLTRSHAHPMGPKKLKEEGIEFDPRAVELLVKFTHAKRFNVSRTR
ncbi:MAG: hypothetical protein ACLRQX_09030 [Turicibacter sanguinis]